MADPAADSGRPTPVDTRRALRLSLWFGLMTGIGSACLIGIQKFVLDDVTLSSPQMVWTAPLMAVALFVPIGLLLSLLVRLLPARHGLRAFVFSLALISCGIGLMIWGKQLADVAVAILSLGIAVQLSRIAVQRQPLFQRFVRTTSIAGVSAVVLATLAVNIGGPLRERWRTAALPEPPAGAPNVLVIILDTVRALSMSLYGYERPTTPNLERIAREGTVFEYAIAPAPWTLPSHASMFTGVPAHELSAGWTERLDTSSPTLAEHFRDRGYRTGGVVANWFYTNSEWGIDRGFLHYTDFTNSLGHALASTSLSNKLLKWMERHWQERFWFYRLSGRRIAPDISADLARWIERDRARPFFAFVNYYDAHDPYVAPDEFLARFDGAPLRAEPPIFTNEDGERKEPTAEQRRNTLRHLDAYDAAVAYLDDEIGKLFAWLERDGRLDNTIVIITADHGEEFGENGRYFHGNSLHMPSLHVPLIIRYPPAVPAGRRIATTASLTDLAATVTDLAGTAGDGAFPGASLARFWESGDRTAEPVLASVRLRNPRSYNQEAELRSVITDDLHYTLSDVGLESLFRYRADPLEQRDVISADPTVAAQVGNLRSYLEVDHSWLEKAMRVTARR